MHEEKKKISGNVGMGKGAGRGRGWRKLQRAHKMFCRRPFFCAMLFEEHDKVSEMFNLAL